jgi:hypothetical protein
LERVLPALIKTKTAPKRTDSCETVDAETENAISDDESTKPRAMRVQSKKDPIDRVLEHIIAEKHKKNKSKCATCPRRESCPKLAAKQPCK